jgi:hypothetical protein
LRRVKIREQKKVGEYLIADSTEGDGGAEATAVRDYRGSE